MAEEPFITQENFKESPYNDATWEIVGPPPQEIVFTPMEVAVHSADHIQIDRVFRDYGGNEKNFQPSRWHLPAELAAELARAADTVQEEVVDLSIKILPEEIERLKEEARREGHAQGVAETEAKQQEQLTLLGSKCEAVLSEIKKHIDVQLADTQASAVSLALAISQKLIGYAVEINPEYIAAIVKEALNVAGGATVRRVRVSPADMEFISIVGLNVTADPDKTPWRFEADSNVASGCLVDTSAGEIDFQIDKAWERIKDQVIKATK